MKKQYKHYKTGDIYEIIDDTIKVEDTNGDWYPGVLYRCINKGKGECYVRTKDSFKKSFDEHTDQLKMEFNEVEVKTKKIPDWEPSTPTTLAKRLFRNKRFSTLEEADKYFDSRIDTRLTKREKSYWREAKKNYRILIELETNGNKG